MAAVQAHRVVQCILTLSFLFISRIGDPTIRLEEDGGAEVLFLVPPVRGAGRRAARAENAFVQAVKLLALLLRLAIFAALQVW